MKSIFKILLLLIFLLSSNVFAKYNRIISLAPSATESLYELDIDKELVANTVYCSDGNFKKEKIGTVTEPNIEKIISLNPDLIIATKEGNYKTVIDKLIRLKLTVYVMEPYSSFEDICINFQQLADYLDKSDTAKEIINNVKNEISKLDDDAKNINKEKIFWEVGANPIFTVGKQSFVNEYNKFVNGINVFEDIDMRYPNISVESVIEKNPDIIMLVNMGDVSEQEIAKWNKYKNITAVKNNKIYLLEANDIFTPTPKRFLNGIKVLKNKLNNTAGD
ncbi:ABC transporter substrate-binding protein [Candidatus Ruminimicrobiellum ovillum]|uniref:ABC transporter substrate-binding protein n=1 Tax=Candidatus Ruminimicrobiellum ovillum TaxID=1947927 RepID=UPI003559D85C